MANSSADKFPIESLTSANGYGLQTPIQARELSGGTNNQTVALTSPSGEFIWRAYQTHAVPETIQYEHQLLAWLSQQALSYNVPAPVPMHNGDTLYHDEHGFQALFPLVPGAIPDRRNPAQMESVGAALGELHRCLARYPQAIRPGLTTYSAIVRAHPHLPDLTAMYPHDVGLAGAEVEEMLFAWWRTEITQVQQWQSMHYNALPHQVIHGDYTPANTLVTDDRVSALLDFDFALLGARAIDVAAGLYFTMRIWDNPDPWPVAEAFCRGYNQWIQLTDAEITAIPWLMRLRSVVSIVWWFGKEAAAGEPVQLWRIEDLQGLVGWLDENEGRLMGLLAS